MDGILNVTVSCFANYGDTNNPKDVNLLKWLTSEKYRTRIEALRAEPDEAVQKALKNNLPGITASAVVYSRNENEIISHSGFLAFDIDQKDNTHITNFADLKSQIRNISCVAYCGLSARGKGFWGLVPIKYPDKHKQHFKTLQNAFSHFNIKIDRAPSNPVSFRYYSYDPAPYFNHQAEILEGYYQPPVYPPRQFSHNVDKFEKRVQDCIIAIEASRMDITSDYSDWIKLGFTFAYSFGENGRDYFHRISQFHPEYSIQDTDKQFDRCLKNGTYGDIGHFFNRCSETGIQYKDATDYQPRLQQPFVEYGKIQETSLLKTEDIRQPTAQTVIAKPKSEPESVEFYHHSFTELCEVLGYDEALEKVRYYQTLSEMYKSCENYVIHSCKLLKTYELGSAT